MTLYFVTGWNKDYDLNVSSIPHAFDVNCEISAGYRTRFGVCTCDDHCSWDLCRLLEPPDDCLLRTNSEWIWDSLKNAYVAQIIEGIFVYLRHRQVFMISTCQKTCNILLNLILH